MSRTNGSSSSTGAVMEPEQEQAQTQDTAVETGAGLEVPAPTATPDEPGPAPAPEPETAASILSRKPKTVMLHPDDIVADETANTRRYGTGDVKSLISAILRDGQQTPVMVRKDKGDGKYHLVFGFRRWKAIQQIDANQIYDSTQWPDGMLVRAEVAELGGKTSYLARLGENEERREHSIMEKAHSIGELEALGLKGTEIAARFGKSTGWVSQTKALLTLPAWAQKKVHTGELGFSAAYEITQIENEKKREAALEVIKAGGAGEGGGKGRGKGKVTKASVRATQRDEGEDDGGGGGAGSGAKKSKPRTVKELRVGWAEAATPPEGEELDWVHKVAALNAKVIEGKLGFVAWRNKLLSLSA